MKTREIIRIAKSTGCIPRNFPVKHIYAEGDTVDVAFENLDYGRSEINDRHLGRDLVQPWLPTLHVSVEVNCRTNNRFSTQDD